MNWKTIAIIFMVITSLLIALFVFSYFYNIQDSAVIDYCHNDICGKYPEALLDIDNFCYCYDYDEDGELFVIDRTLIE